MEQNLFTGIRPLYSSRRESPNEIRIRIRMRDLIDPLVLRSSVETTMRRYPYFCVELKKKNGQYVFIDNERPVVISASLDGVELNSEESNLHMIAFAYRDNWIEMNVFHGLTDGTGAYEVIRTLLYYYCSKKYDVKLNDEEIRLAGEEISKEEWLYPNAKDAIRIALCVNQRNALHAPKAHQSLVGGVMLEYKDELKDWPLTRQATAFRGMVFAQTTDEAILAGVNNLKGVSQMLLSKETDQERIEVAGYIGSMSNRILTATVSYVGKADYKEAERYIRDFRTWTSPSGNMMLVEISAVNGRFVLDIIQPFSNPLFVNAFLKELEDNGITYDLQDVQELKLPNIKLPWSE